jgi:hypothetical protein
MLQVVLLVAALTAPAPVPSASASPTPTRVLGLIRAQFRSHRPPPPFETYTFTRKQNAANGYPDPAESYVRHLWVRNSDRAALSRYEYRDDANGPLEFDRPAFNEARDPGPPTADVFEPAPSRPHPVEEVPTPEPVATPQLQQIGQIRTLLEFDYNVDSLDFQGADVHLVLSPKRTPERNRVREIWADRKTYELHRLIATDTLFAGRDGNFPVLFTITMARVDGVPVVRSLHGVVGGGYTDDGAVVDMTFTDVKFPATLPDWYFDKRQYAQHLAEAPQ